MIKWLRTKWVAYLLKIVQTKNRAEYARILQLRSAKLTEFFEELLPTLDKRFEQTMMIRDGRWNYLVHDDDTYPLFDFVFPQLHLFVYVCKGDQGEWDSARSLGFTYEEWERGCARAEDIKTILKLPTASLEDRTRLLVIGWAEPINNLGLYKRVKKALTNAPDN